MVLGGSNFTLRAPISVSEPDPADVVPVGVDIMLVALREGADPEPESRERTAEDVGFKMSLSLLNPDEDSDDDVGTNPKLPGLENRGTESFKRDASGLCLALLRLSAKESADDLPVLKGSDSEANERFVGKNLDCLLLALDADSVLSVSAATELELKGLFRRGTATITTT